MSSYLYVALPQPKLLDHSEPVTTVSTADDELEEVVKPKQAQMADAPKPPPKKSGRVKITIPALQQVNAQKRDI